MKVNQKGFTAIEGLLILVILGLVGFTGYYVWHSKQQTDKTLDSAQSESASTPKITSTIKTFADCQKAVGSITQQSYPEVCMTKSGQRFTQPTSSSSLPYLTIKEWNIKVSFANAADVTYEDLACGSPNCSTNLSFNNSTTTNSTCKPILEIVQENDGSMNPSPNIKIGSSSYGLIKVFNTSIENEFSSCPQSVNNLRNSVRQSIGLDSLSQL